MNVHYQVTQLLSKANTVHTRVTSNGDNFSRRQRRQSRQNSGRVVEVTKIDAIT